MKLRQIVATEGIPGSIPAGTPAGWGAPAAALAEGTQQLGREAARTSVIYAHAEAAMREAESKVEASEQFTSLKERLAASEQVTRDRLGKDLHPDEYTTEVTKAITEAMKESEAALRYPESRARFRQQAGLYAAEQRIKARAEGVKIKHTILNVREDLELDKLANDAVYSATQADKDAARDRGLEIIEGGLAGGRRTEADVRAQSRRFIGNITRGRILSEFNDPSKQEQIIGLLNQGKYPTLDPDDQVKLATHLMTVREAKQREAIRLQEKQEKEDAKREEKAREAEVDTLDVLADDGKLSAETLRQAIADRVVMGADARRLSDKIRTGGAAGGRTDDGVYNKLELDLLENPLSHSGREIRRIQASGKLAASGPRSAATLLKLIPDDKERAEKDITQKPLFKQGLHELRESLRGGVGPLESLTREQATRLENAEREYHDLARSGKFGEEALPEVARKIVERLRKQTPATGDPDTRRLLRYASPQDLLAAKKAGLIPDAEFNRQMELMRQLGILTAPTPKGSTSGGR